MHTPETQQRFIQRRAEGWTFARLAAELGVAKSTLIEWSRRFRFDIDNQRALELDELQARVLGTRPHRVAALTEKLARVEEELRQRGLDQIPTARLYSLADSLRRQLGRELGPVRFVTPVNSIPGDEYVEQVQEWTP